MVVSRAAYRVADTLCDRVLSVMDRWEPVNALQRLIADYISEHPGESYSSIGRRGGMPRQTVYALAKRGKARQTPRPDTLEALAKGLQMPLPVVRAAAGMTAGYYGENLAQVTDERMRLLIATLVELDEERLSAAERRARSLLAEQREEEAARKRRRRNGNGNNHA